MLIFKTKDEIQDYLKEKKSKIGFVPTMGALHMGHISLIEKAKKENDLSICSIFVNPTQFNNNEDLKKYPRTLESDCQLLKAAGCDIVFAPNDEEMYPQPPLLSINFGYLEKIMEGEHRPGHFNGVGIIVSKLFNIIKPNNAYFGLKDLQQVTIIKKLVLDLSFDLTIVPCPIIRDPDGLAMSSRNARLTKEERILAPMVYQSLENAKKLFIEGKSIKSIKEATKEFFSPFNEFKLEYLDIVAFDDLLPIEVYSPKIKTAICTANYLGNVRLIDNLVF